MDDQFTSIQIDKATRSELVIEKTRMGAATGRHVDYSEAVRLLLEHWRRTRPDECDPVLTAGAALSAANPQGVSPAPSPDSRQVRVGS